MELWFKSLRIASAIARLGDIATGVRRHPLAGRDLTLLKSRP